MVSKAERDRKHKAVLAKKVQGAGRPRLEGERYPSGKLKLRKNDRLIEAKRQLVGKGLDIGLADDPLDFIHAKGWLSTRLYRVALAYRDARRRVHVGAPGLGAGGVAETSSTTGVEGRSFDDMTAREITEVFDHVFRDAPSTTAEEREAQALQRWKRLEAAMSPDQSREVGLIVVRTSWAFWMTALNLGKDLTDGQALARRRLEEGLEAMGRVLHPPRASVDSALNAVEALPAPLGNVRKLEEQLRFVDEDGSPVEMTATRTGKPFAVARKRACPRILSKTIDEYS